MYLFYLPVNLVHKPQPMEKDTSDEPTFSFLAVVSPYATQIP